MYKSTHSDLFIINLLGDYLTGAFGKYIAWSLITNLFIVGISLNNYRSAMLGHKSHKDAVMQA